jgi:hypothetical protein
VTTCTLSNLNCGYRKTERFYTRGWFMRKLRKFFPKDIGGQSMRAGGATSLAEAGVAPPVIQAIGWWASNTFQIYI